MWEMKDRFSSIWSVREEDIGGSRLLPCKLTPKPHFAVPQLSHDLCGSAFV